VSWYHRQDFINEFPNITPIFDRLFVTEGRVTTSAGGAAAIDLAAWMIERHLGRAYAQKSMDIRLVDQPRPPQAPQPRPPIAADVSDPSVKRAILLMEQHINQPLGVREIAVALSLSTRQLERRFIASLETSVHVYYRRLRLHYGLWQLTNCNVTIAEIAYASGFSDASHFNRLFRKEFGLRPSEVRAALTVGASPEIRPPGSPLGTGSEPGKRAVRFLRGERRPYPAPSTLSSATLPGTGAAN
jgi:transcriptional regulator GlxA family with amidase domain